MGIRKDKKLDRYYFDDLRKRMVSLNIISSITFWGSTGDNYPSCGILQFCLSRLSELTFSKVLGQFS